MGMSTHVVGIVPPDAEWKKMKAVWDSCAAAEIDIPEKVSAFFNGEEPDESGVIVALHLSPATSRWSDDSRDGFEVDIEKLPKHVKRIRFYNSY